MGDVRAYLKAQSKEPRGSRTVTGGQNQKRRQEHRTHESTCGSSGRAADLEAGCSTHLIKMAQLIMGLRLVLSTTFLSERSYGNPCDYNYRVPALLVDMVLIMIPDIK